MKKSAATTATMIAATTKKTAATEERFICSNRIATSYKSGMNAAQRHFKCGGFSA
jgi:hypothetical protein